MIQHKDNKCSLCCTKIESFSVKRGNLELLTDVNLHIHCGELTAVIGPNGAGKSTLLKAILGEIQHEGRLLFHDEKDSHISSPIIGYVPQQLSFDRSTPASVLDFFAACKTKRPVWASCSQSLKREVQATLDKFSVGYTLNRRLGELSGGELQRVLLALALDPIPDILLLDEPVSGVDMRGLDMFYQTVSALRKEYDMTIMLISHDLPLIAKYADRVIYLNKRVISSGTPKQVYSSSEFINSFGKISV